MTKKSAPPVVVGIDGSETSLHAAQWATAEAVSRSAPLRLVYVANGRHPSAEDYYADIHHGEESLRQAQKAVEETGQPVEIQKSMVSGMPSVSLAEESTDAALLCVGSVGINRYARDILGSTATDVAARAKCPVAIIRPQDEVPRNTPNWIVVAVEPGRDSVVQCAMEEARLRQAPVLMLGSEADSARAVESWTKRYPDVHAYPVSNGTDIARFMKSHEEWIQLAVVGAADADEIASILGPYGHPRFHRTVASVLVA